MNRYERHSARRYWHGAGSAYRRCQVGLCLRCWWRQLTGGFRREKAAAVALANEHIAKVRDCERTHGHDWWPVPVGGTTRPQCSMCHVIRWEVKR